MPRPDFPRNIFEFQSRFSTEEACVRFLMDSRWPDGFVCPRCGTTDFYWIENRNILQCRGCRYQASATAGTVMHRSKQPLRVWFYAAYLVTTHTPGLSAVQFQRQVGLSRYETAFMMLHKLRAAMVREDRDKLTGIVEVDEAYVGGPEPGGAGRRAVLRSVVAGAVEVRGGFAGRVRLRAISNAGSAALHKFVQANIEPGSVVRTDAWQGYAGVDQFGYAHERIVQGSPANAGSTFPHVHRVFSNLKTWLLGTHHGVSKQHLQAYLNEFTFRYNRRRTPMAAFQTVLGLVAERRGPTYGGLYGVGKGVTEYAHPNPLLRRPPELTG